MGDSGNGLHFSGIVVAVLILAAWMLQSPPLAPSRPQHGDQARDKGNSFEDVPARLWQDPFDTVQRYRDGQKLSIQIDAKPQGQLAIPLKLTDGNRTDLDHDLDKLSRYVREACQPLQPTVLPRPADACDAADNKLSILPVMVSTAPYAEVREHRLRVRAAVIAGLGNNGIVPLDGSHIGYWFKPRHPGPNGIEIPEAVIPYELYKGRGRTVLVLWLPAPHFAREPLARLAVLAACLRSTGLLRDDGRLAPGRLTVLGPPDSDGLAQLAQDALKWRARPLWAAPLAGMELLSATATAPAGDIMPADPQGRQILADEACRKSSDCRLASLFDNLGIRLIRSTITDEHIASAMVDELALRGADPVCAEGRRYPNRPCREEDAADDDYAGHRDHVVLISEADTSFGRTLPALFEQTVVDRLTARQPPGAKPPAPNWLHRFGYLRGLDGELPNVENEKKASTPTSLEDLSRIDLAALEPATGTSQFDYLRRLAEQIYALDHRLRDNAKGRVRAIGVLGSDFYDKLLILQAMREHFPNHVFFTNDLDARYLNPDDYRWTRNLVIVSAFGLQLHPGWQRLVPPLRGTYQTSLFLATQLALGLGEDDRSTGRLRPHLSPRIFEVARGRFIDLSTPADADDARLADIALDELPPVHPAAYAPPPMPPQWRWILAGGVLMGALVFLLASPVRSRFWGKGHWGDLGWAALWTLLGTALLGWAYCWMLEQPEPFVWAAGVSMWPSALIYMLCVPLSVLFLWLAVRSTLKAEDELALEFKLQADDELPRRPTTFQAVCAYLERHGPLGLVRPLRHLWFPHLKRAFTMLTWYDKACVHEHVRDVRAIWTNYRAYSSNAHRFTRAGATFLVLWVIAWIALVFVQPLQIPFRGSSAFDFVFWLGMLPLAFSFGLLLFWVMDETRLCSALVRQLCQSGQHWPGVEEDVDEQLAKGREKAFCRFADRHGVKDAADCAPRTRTAYQSALRDSRIQLENKRRTVDFIAKRTDPAGNLIWYPFVILILILISLSTRFDNYDTKTSVIGLLGTAIAIALSSAYMLRRTANNAKREIVGQLRTHMLDQQSTQARTEPEQVEVLIKQIEEIHQGAFRPWYQEPLVRGLIWVGSMAAVIITEYVTVSG